MVRRMLQAHVQATVGMYMYGRKDTVYWKGGKKGSALGSWGLGQMTLGAVEGRTRLLLHCILDLHAGFVMEEL